ncbi:MAG TPA: ubiquinol-cytochrome C chaperone family protein [Caulobacterales bacterium]|nr:ubiquinol-cytochrome C chaperone family protein [Caulobacterales bacterium]
MAVWPFRRSPARKDAERLLGAVVLISRQPAFFGEGRAPDTLEGRFEVLALHAALALIRLGRDDGLTPLAQEFTDRLFRHLDGGLREAAVGDMAVPRRMQHIAGQFYARLDAYAKALAAGDTAALEADLSRYMIKANGTAAFAPALGRYVLRTAELQAGAPIETLFRFDGWASPPE